MAPGLLTHWSYKRKKNLQHLFFVLSVLLATHGHASCFRFHFSQAETCAQVLSPVSKEEKDPAVSSSLMFSDVLGHIIGAASFAC